MRQLPANHLIKLGRFVCYSHLSMYNAMKNATTTTQYLALLALPVLLTFTLSGCVLLGLGAAAGAAVGGCAILDENDDDRVTEAEVSAALFDDWDTDNDNALTEAEFEAGVAQEDIFSDWSGNFDEWDADADGELSEAEYRAGVSEDGDSARWADRQCDDLGL